MSSLDRIAAYESFLRRSLYSLLFFPPSTKTTFPISMIQFNSSLNNVNHLLYLTSTQAVTALQCAPERLALLLLTLRFGVTSTTGAA